MKLAVGCPVRDRNWILPKWKEHVENALPEGWDLIFIFVVSKEDHESIKLLDSWDNSNVVLVDEKYSSYSRYWNSARYNEMVFLRNSLLKAVRYHEPDLFLSLDSDILLHKDAIANMYETLMSEDDNLIAVGGLTWLDPTDERVTNAAMLRSDLNGFRRVPDRGQFFVDVIMAIKLMSPIAYSIEYKYDSQGEDIGWSRAVKEAGYKLKFDSRLGNRHVWNQDWINIEDKRCSI